MSQVLFPAFSLTKPSGRLLYAVSPLSGGKEKLGNMQTPRPCGTEPPCELLTWEEPSREANVFSPSHPWALSSADRAAGGVESPSLEIFKTHLDKVLYSLL